MPFEPISPVGGFTATPELPRPDDETRPDPTFGETLSSAFRNENTIGSLLASQELANEHQERDPYFDPWAEIAETPYEAYYEQFARARNPAHFQAIKADIDRENTDRDVIARSGLTGFGASAAAGLLDWPTLIPGGALVRTAKGGVSLLRSTASVAAAGAVGAGAAEAVLQGTQQLRTGAESAVVIGGATILSGVLGAGLAKWVSRGELDALAPRVERDFQVPGADEADVFEPGALRPSVEAAAGASPRAAEVADAIRETAEEILPAQVRVQVVDTLGPVGDDGLFAIRAFHGTPHDFDRFDMSKIGTGEGAQVFGHGLYFAENRAVAENYRVGLSAERTLLDGKPIAQDSDLMRLVQVKILGKDEFGAPWETFRPNAEKALADAKAVQVPDAGSPAARFANLEDMKARRERNIQDAQDWLEKIEAVEKGKLESGGHLYDVELDVEPNQLLDWDLPLTRQPEAVQAAMRKLGIDPVEYRDGQWLYHEIWRRDESGDGPEVASVALKEAGIPGIRYLDQDSRAVDGERTRNMVVFDDSLVKITRKNGEPVSAAERKDAVETLFSLRSREAAGAEAADITGTQVFKRWFGDSKIVDADGNPLKLYHGTGEAFERFDPEKSVEGGIFFGTDPSIARDYTFKGETPRVIEAYAAIRNPKVIDAGGDDFSDASLGKAPEGSDDKFVLSRPAPSAKAKAFGDYQSGYRTEASTPNGRKLEIFIGIKGERETTFRDVTTRHVSYDVLSADGTVLRSDKEFTFRDDDPFFPDDRFEDVMASHVGLDMSNPFYSHSFPRLFLKQVIDEAKAEGYDGLWLRNGMDMGREAHDQVVAFRADQVKIVGSGTRHGLRQSPAGPIAEGRFDRDKLLITIAADALDPAKTLRHESIHALKTMGLFAGKDWATLEAAAAKGKWLETHNVRQLYEGVYKDRITDELLMEEAIAEQFSLWRQGKLQAKGALAAIFQRIQAFLERTGNALRGRGFQTADDVFAAVRSGDVASRAAPPAPSPGVTTAVAAATGRATSVGAAAVRRAEDTLKSAFGAEKLFRYQDPMLRLQTSRSDVSRRHVQELAETPLTYEKNALGEETAPGGSDSGAPGAVETRIKFWQGPLAEAMQAVDDAFLKYRKGRGKRFIGEVPALTMKDTLLGTQALTYRDFKGKISQALRRGDESDIPEVAVAARIIRQRVLDPLKDEAIAAKLLPEDVSVETAASYLNRVYNKERIVAERDQFKQVVRDWLEGQESINRGVRARLAPMLERLDTVGTDSSKLAAGIQKSEARLKDLEARAEEAGRVQRFAFKRALERREPIEALQNRIADLGQQIEGPLDSLSSMRDLDSRITDAQQIARAMQEDDGGDLAAQIADVAELEENIDEMIAKAEAGIERITEAGDLPLPRVEGRYAGGALEGDEIDEIASSWRFLREMKARRKPEGLTSFVVRMGGVEDPGGDVMSMIGRSKDRPGLIRKGPDDAGPQLPLGDAGGTRPNTLDAMALRAWENGFFPSKTERPTINEFLDALREDVAGNPMVRGEDEAYFVDAERAGQLAEDLASRGIDPAAFRRESQLRLFLGQAPREALAGEAGAGLKTLRLIRKQLGDTIDPYRKRITALTRDARRRERNESLRQSERGVFATQSRNRGRSLADRTFAERGKLEKQRADLAAKEATAADLQKAIEEEVTKYQGKSANEAKSALERREEAELLREEKRQVAIARRDELQRLIAGEERALVAAPDEQRLLSLQTARDELAELEKAVADPKRLRAADKPVLASARRIADQLDKEPGEIGDLADEIIDRIIGTPDGRLPYDAHLNSTTSHGVSVDARGPLAARQFMIPDLAIERWLESDVEALLRAYTRTMAPDVELTKRFGTADMKLQIKEIAEDYARRSAAAATPAERRRLNARRNADIRDLAAIRDRIRGTYKVPSDPNAILVRAGRVASSLNYMRMLGGMTLSAIPDVGGIVFSHGMARVFGDGLVPLMRNWQGARIAMTEVKMAGTALDMVLDSRAMAIADVMDEFGRHSKFERAVSSAARNFGVVSLQAPWNAAMKQFAGLITMTRMLRAVERIAAGKGTAKEVERLASAGISQANARRIAEQFAKHGKKGGGVWFANTAEWDAGSRPAIEAFRAALVRDVDRIIITPGQDRPLWMSTELGRLVGQFKSFAIAAMQRVVIAGLQQGFITRDMATLSGIAMMTALGGLSGILKAKVAGQPMPDLSDNKKKLQFLVEAIDRSGLTGWLMDVNAMTEKLTRGAVGLSAITGKPVSRFAQRNIASTLFGPTAGTIQEFARVVGAAGAGEWNQSDSRAMRRLIPYNNIFYLRQLFDEAEQGINDFLGVPKPAGARR